MRRSVHGRTTARVAPTGLQERMQGPETPGGPVCRPYENRETSQDTPSPEPHLSPTHAKGARNKKSFRFPIFVYKSRRRRPPTQSPAKRVCVGEDTRPQASVSERNRRKAAALSVEMERWSERALPNPGEARDTKSVTTKWPGGNLDTHSNFARRMGTSCPKGYPP